MTRMKMSRTSISPFLSLSFLSSSIQVFTQTIHSRATLTRLSFFQARPPPVSRNESLPSSVPSSRSSPSPSYLQAGDLHFVSLGEVRRKEVAVAYRTGSASQSRIGRKVARTNRRTDGLACNSHPPCIDLLTSIPKWGKKDSEFWANTFKKSSILLTSSKSFAPKVSNRWSQLEHAAEDFYMRRKSSTCVERLLHA